MEFWFVIAVFVVLALLAIAVMERLEKIDRSLEALRQEIRNK